MNRVKEINRIFLATIIISILGAYVNTLVYEKTNNYSFVLIMSQVVLILPTVIYLLVTKVNVAKLIRFKGVRLSNIILLLLFSYLILPLMNLINAISMMYVQNDTAEIINDISSNNSFYVSLFLIAFIPCVLEEAVYRGVFYNEYRKVNTLKGIVLSGFLFGIMHGNFNQFSYAFVMGIVFAFLIEATDSILSTMIVHFVINGSSVTILYLYPKLLKVLEAVYGVEQFNADEIMNSVNSVGETLTFEIVISTYGIPAVLCTILAIIVLKTIAKNEGRWNNVKEIFKKSNPEELQLYDTADKKTVRGKLLTPSLCIAIIICIFMMVRAELYSIDQINAGVDEFLFFFKQWIQ